MAADGAFNVVEQFHAKAGKGAKDLNIHFIAAAAVGILRVVGRARTQTVRNAQ